MLRTTAALISSIGLTAGIPLVPFATVLLVRRIVTQEAIQLWTEAIELAPKNSAAWSNRGTVLLQAGRCVRLLLVDTERLLPPNLSSKLCCWRGWVRVSRWQEARDDLARARALDEEAGGGAAADSLVLNNLANAEGALGHWDTAIQLYKEAAAQNDGEVQVKP
mmetsp:Transcript_42145/g.75633  ORF Transcript_42145/g.75633 Transcript_42145/m.75633 type:complete len:164 (-) Transcript_42145:734-1225(-)